MRNALRVRIDGYARDHHVGHLQGDGQESAGVVLAVRLRLYDRRPASDVHARRHVHADGKLSGLAITVLRPEHPTTLR